jgi:hypothetical protein
MSSLNGLFGGTNGSCAQWGWTDRLLVVGGRIAVTSISLCLEAVFVASTEDEDNPFRDISCCNSRYVGRPVPAQHLCFKHAVQAAKGNG